MRIKYFCFIMFLNLFLLAGCASAQTEIEVTDQTITESDASVVIATESTETILDDTITSQENLSQAEHQLIPASELYSKRISEYGSYKINLDAIKENINKENTNYYCYRKDDAVESYMPFVSGHNFGMNYDVCTGELLDFKDLWREDVEIYELLKPYLIENTTRYSVVEDYEEVIQSMEEYPGIWYWCMDATGIMITFRRYVICYPEYEYLLTYAEWGQYLKEAYLPDMNEIIGRIGVNEELEIDGGKLEIIDDPIFSREAVIKTNKSEIMFGETYGDCLEAYIMNDDDEGYYLLINSAGETGWDDGSILVYYICEEVVTQVDHIALASIYDVKAFDNITLIQGQYRLSEEGKLVAINGGKE